MQRLCAFILFYLVIGCLSTSVYAELYMWTDENGIKHYSNTKPNEQGKNIKQKGEIIFDAKHQEILEQQKARIQAEAEQQNASLREEIEREKKKKFVHDVVYGTQREWELPPPWWWLEKSNRDLEKSSQEWNMKRTVKDAVREEMKWDRLMQPYKSKYR